MAYLLYNLLLTFAAVVLLPFVPLLFLLGERFHAGLAQRFARYPATFPGVAEDARPLWVHASSVGEALAAGALTRALKARFPNRAILLSTFTHSGQLIARNDPHADAVLYLPLDLRWLVRSALKKIQPAALILIETEIWPNLVREAYRRGVATFLVSGRVSDRAFGRYLMGDWFFRRVLACFTALGMQSETDAERIIRLGAPPARVRVTGNLKEAVEAEGNEPARSPQEERNGGADRPLWVVGSSHRGEEEIVLEAFLELKKRFPGLRLALAPRHPQRFPEVEELLGAKGLEFEKKSRLNGALTGEKDVTFVDTLGDLVRFYASGDVAFVGGSLVDAGGHNLLEPARHSLPVLFGPHTQNFAPIASALKSCGGGIEVRGAGDLVREVGALLADPERRRSSGASAYELATRNRQVLDRHLALLETYLVRETRGR